MKTAVSIPDKLFADAEQLISRLKTSRSQLYARALAEFVARHDEDHVTQLLNEALADAGQTEDSFVRRAATKALGKVEW